MKNYILYATPVSLFSGKARAYLNWKGVPFDEVLSSTEVMREILPIIGWPVIPVMRRKTGELIQDTGDIIAFIEDNHPEPPVMPTGTVQRFVSELLHVYGDEWLTIPAMHYRWHYNEDFAYAEFGKTAAPDSDPETQFKIGQKNGTKFKGFVPMLGIVDHTIPAIETSYKAFLDEFSAHLRSHQYLLGDRPSLADFAFFGPLYAHLYRDPASGELMKSHAPNVAEWVERLLSSDTQYSELRTDDRVPETLYPMLARHFSEHLPVLQQTNELLGQWAANQSSEEEVPRALGMAEFTIEGVKGQIIARPFSLYRLQAAMDIYADMTIDEKRRADSILDQTGGVALKSFNVAARLTRSNYKLVLA